MTSQPSGRGSLYIRALAASHPGERSPIDERERLSKLLAVSQALDHVHDLDSVLERVLAEARAFTNADAGTIYLVEGDRLRFAFVAPSATGRRFERYRYQDHTMPVTQESIAGYVALTGQPLAIEDAYEIPEEMPFSFNADFDRRSNYRTVSMFTTPLKTNRGDIVGVVQLINAQDEDMRQPIPFSSTSQLYLSLFARDAAVAIERASATRSIILRMVRMAELRDPKETGPHVNRVAAYSVELYQRWADLKGVPGIEIRRTRDLLRLGAMLHDAGKIAIPDAILKKPGPLTPPERSVMQEHTVIGARLFSDQQSRLDEVSAEIALRHHERWDGSGYPGRIDDLTTEPIGMGTGLKGTEIPLFGRIVALTDVYDALSSKRTYKEAWKEEYVLATVKTESGKHFDPELVRVFLSIHEVIREIRTRYAE